MKKIYLIIFLWTLLPFLGNAQEDTAVAQVNELDNLLKQTESIRISDSLKRLDLENQYNLLKENESRKKEQLMREINKLRSRDSIRNADLQLKAQQIIKSAKRYPVTLLSDTLFFIYANMGPSSPRERASNISARIRKLYENDFFKSDSLIAVESDNTVDISYKDVILMSVSDLDARIANVSKSDLAMRYIGRIRSAIVSAKKENGITRILIRLGLAVIVIGLILLLIWLIGKIHARMVRLMIRKKDSILRDYTYKNYTFLTASQGLKILYVLLNLARWFFIILSLYLVLPIVFSLFPFTQMWAGTLFKLVWEPFKGLFLAIWDYLPNLFTIAVIFIVFRYCLRAIKYIFSEIALERLKISGFHADWAMPTFSIVRFLIYDFNFVLIFTYMPGYNSDIFKGVSVFLGILFSLGSSSAIANSVAGLVITYMRPFKIGDRIRIGDITGDVIEKTLLVTRLRTIKNEEITMPNSAILTGNTINYSTCSKNEGLIIHSTVTIGYDTPWKDIHDALIAAALKTDLILPHPAPFVLQTSLDDFYVSYQINAYIHEANQMADIYSHLHENIQDVCNERGIEIMSPHYRAQRDGNKTTIPAPYLPLNYSSPKFAIDVKKNEEK